MKNTYYIFINPRYLHCITSDNMFIDPQKSKDFQNNTPWTPKGGGGALWGKKDKGAPCSLQNRGS